MAIPEQVKVLLERLEKIDLESKKDKKVEKFEMRFLIMEGITEGLKELLLRNVDGFQNLLVRFIELMDGDLYSGDPKNALTELQTKYAVLKPKLSDDKVLIGMFMNFLEKSNNILCMEIKEVFREKIVKQQFTEVSVVEKYISNSKEIFKDKTDKIAKVAKLIF
uniref:F-type ATPase subunit delta n=1 Tax=Strongyloides venezuelensis TaxID=75913 RepID=A0A0K0F2A9_STRVS